MPISKLVVASVMTLASTLGASAQTLTATVQGVRNAEGDLIIAVFDDAKSFKAMDMTNAAALASVPAVKGLASVTFHNLPPGTYAIAGIHDENSNSNLDTEKDVPTEGYGFGGMGQNGLPPEFANAAVTVGTGVTANLKLKYWK
ncbi:MULTISPECIES: DUF2141 domain-containing protein [unclassified Ruegeria]|uniref:DUF2141 domain-containing protein n=1 Tax=unclassified Ruegeria TaxID=2625375 RepID=UPI00149244C0|nr:MULTISPECIES: DUF2141 domain-containing protein [unclassified Ruegeria]NOC47689.1 DUF2141 domain-containing protein [Ruegeria sp. HKCCD7559]NOD86638.1 DUF2141 domain-containing protein [Ruegeria sp. HKCCD6119]